MGASPGGVEPLCLQPMGKVFVGLVVLIIAGLAGFAVALGLQLARRARESIGAAPA